VCCFVNKHAEHGTKTVRSQFTKFTVCYQDNIRYAPDRTYIHTKKGQHCAECYLYVFTVSSEHIRFLFFSYFASIIFFWSRAVGFISNRAHAKIDRRPQSKQLNQSIYFAIKGHRPLTNHTSSTNITTERKAKLYKLCRYS